MGVNFFLIFWLDYSITSLRKFFNSPVLGIYYDSFSELDSSISDSISIILSVLIFVLYSFNFSKEMYFLIRISLNTIFSYLW